MKHFTLLLVAAASLCTNAFAQTRAKNIYTSTTKLNLEILQNQTQPVVLNRTLFAGYNTICLPMSLSAEQLQEAAKDVQVERLEVISQEGSTLNMYFLDCTNEGIEAGVPYLVFSPTRQYLRVTNTEATHIDSNIKTLRINDGQGNQIAFGSNWSALQKEGHYGIPAKQNVEILESVLMRTTSEMTMLPTRCSFTWEQQSATADKLEIMHVSPAEATAIRTVNTDNNTSVDMYDMQGRRVTNNHRGIVIQNGTKYAK